MFVLGKIFQPCIIIFGKAGAFTRVADLKSASSARVMNIIGNQPTCYVKWVSLQRHLYTKHQVINKGYELTEARALYWYYISYY